ncbi:MAG: substrate-binding domain-containing protein [Anaerolineae bacterium]|nr:substrate-binding domain-containing protein [Anaerolineae bacterium]
MMYRKYRTRLTLGVFVSLFGGYQDAIWKGIVQVAEEHNADVLCFVGAALEDEVSFRKDWNAIYDLASPANLDGLIMLSAALQNYVTIEKLSQFYAHYAPLPIISIAQELDGIPSITVDNSAGLHDLMEHLIEQHQYRRIAFIRGPENNPEAETRYRVYTETLEMHGIPFDPDLVAPGNFIGYTGNKAIELLLDQRKASFDAVVASNDYMAIGAWQELNKRGFDVPTDVAVAGFDDVPEARIFARRLTTVRQPLAEEGRQAARMLLEYLRNNSPPENLTLGTELVVRESCGCLPSLESVLVSSTPIMPADPSERALTQQRDVVLADIQKLICPYFSGLTPQSIELLVDAFLDVLRGKASLQFLQIFSRLLRRGVMNLAHTELQGQIMCKWHEVLSILREKALPYKYPDVTTDIERLLHQAGTLITEVTGYAHLNWQSSVTTNLLIQADAIRDINMASTTQEIADVLAQNLLRLDIRTCFLALYEGEPVPPSHSRLIMAYHNGKRVELEPDGLIFPSTQLVPQAMLPGTRPSLLMIRPLVIRDIQFGFVVMEMNIQRWTTLASTYEQFPEQIGSALYKVLLQQRIEKSNKDLQEHAVELAETNSQLAEANAQLEQFAYIASHDLQEPLRMVTNYLQLLEKRYRDRLDDDAKEFINYAVDGAARMKQLINDLLAYSRVTTQRHPLEPADCEQLLDQALSNLEVAVKENDALVTHDPLPTVMADSTQLVGVFQNLIGNAIKFHADRQPQVHVSARRKDSEWVFFVKDNGIGIASEYTERIFVIFSRLHTMAEYPGTGIGLAICKKVVERHGGHIWVESHPGKGSTFFFTLPA